MSDDINADEIAHRFGHHKATIEGPNATATIHEYLRVEYQTFALKIVRSIPEGRERDIALTELESASMWSHKALARTGELVSPAQVYREIGETAWDEGFSKGFYEGSSGRWTPASDASEPDIDNPYSPS